MPKPVTVAQAIMRLRATGGEKEAVTYIYVLREPDNVLLGVVDLRDLVRTPEVTTLEDIMASPAVSADSDLVKQDLIDLFKKYQFRLFPVVDTADHLLGVIAYKDIMR